MPKQRVTVKKSTAKKLHTIKKLKEHKRILTNFLILKKFSKPTLNENKEPVLNENQVKASILMESLAKTIKQYAAGWKMIVNAMNNAPDDAEDIYKALSGGNINVDDSAAITSLKDFIQEISVALDKIEKAKQAIEKTDEETSEFISNTIAGNDLVAGEDITDAMDDDGTDETDTLDFGEDEEDVDLGDDEDEDFDMGDEEEEEE